MMNIYSTTRFFFPCRQLLLLILLISFTRGFSYAQIATSDYVTTWQTDAGGSGSNQITIPAYGEYTVYYESIPAGISGTLPETGTLTDFQTITFPVAGTYRVAIKPTGTVPFHRVSFQSVIDLNKLLTIEQWGQIVWSSFRFAYYGCNALTTLSEIDAPILSSVTDMHYAFSSCDVLTGSSNMNSWNVSTIINMEGMFGSSPVFNQPLADWDVSNVTDMSFMFGQAAAFNQPIGNWDVGNVVNMTDMFRFATSFNQPLEEWDVSKVERMDQTFGNATSFNQPLNTWNVSSVTEMPQMFRNATAFNQPLNTWNVSNVTEMNGMFNGATAFNQPLSSWNVSNVTDLRSMFAGATAFNRSLQNWVFGSEASLGSMLNNSGIDCANYTSMLVAWAANPSTPDDLGLGATGIVYGQAGADARDMLINTKGWSFSRDIFDPTCTSLPVTLVSFDAERQELSALLSWSTTEETNSDYFEIQRSADTQHWNAIGTVPAAGESMLHRAYRFSDPSPLTGINYYRLRMVDKDKTFAHSRIQSVKYFTDNALSIYPNPAGNRLLIKNYAQVKQVELYNVSGVKVLENKKVTAHGLDLHQFSQGMYIVKMLLTDGSTQTNKIAISR